MYFGNWKGWLIKGLAILTIFLAVTAWQGRNLISKQTPAPSFRLPALSGPTVALEDLRGRRVLLYFLHRGAKSVISASAILTGLGGSGMKNRYRSSLLHFLTRSYRVLKPFWSAMPSTCPCCSGLGSYSTPIESAPSPPSMY